MRFRLPKPYAFSLVLSQDESNLAAFLRVLPSCLCMWTFLGLAKSRQCTPSSSSTVLHGSTWCEEHCMSGFTTFSSSCDWVQLSMWDAKLNGTSSMKYKLLPIVRYEDVAQHLWWSHFSSRVVSLNGSKVQSICCKNSDKTVILFCCFFSRWSWTNLCQWSCLLHLFGIWWWALMSLGTYEFPMNCSISVSRSCECSCRTSLTDKFRDLGLPAVSSTPFIGWQVVPISLMNRNMVFWHFTLRMLFLLFLHGFSGSLHRPGVGFVSWCWGDLNLDIP